MSAKPPDKEEEWRPVVGYEGLYEVSSLGRIRSLDREVHYPDGCSKVRWAQRSAETNRQRREKREATK